MNTATPLPKRPRRTAALLALTTLALAACQTAPQKPLDRSHWQTHCFGRVLVDLPPQAKLKVRHEVAGFRIERLPANNPSELLRLIDAREAALQQEKHRKEGVMFIRRETLPGGSIALISWEDNFFTSSWRIDHYLHTEAPESPFRAYKSSRSFGKSSAEHMAPLAEKMAQRLRSTPDGQFPREAGVCLDGGYLADNDWHSENVEGHFTMDEHPNMVFKIDSDTSAGEETLLERAANPLLRLAARMNGISALRSRERPVDVFAGQEHLNVFSEYGQQGYNFMWEAQGQRKRRERPFVGFELSVTPQERFDKDGKKLPPPPPAFANHGEALRLWDSVVETLRLRPGAV